MNFAQIIKSIGYRLGIPGRGNAFTEMSEMQVPPGWGYQTYLQAYGQIGWLFACVNAIASAVAKVPWHLYEVDVNGERTEIFQHPLIDLMNNVNPFYTRYQFMYLGTMYKLLVGEEFWQINFNQGGKPGELWLAPPAFMTVVPSAQNYIDHYEYKRGAMATAQSFTIDEIIHIMTPNPYNPYRGLSPAQALTTDLDSERFASRYQQKLFFNDATPGFVVKYPAVDMPSMETRKELMQEWDERFKGFRNRGKTAFLWGGEPQSIVMNNTDMDFAALRKFSRDAILGAYRIHPSVIGATSGTSRAEAEAGQYQFAMYAVDPELSALREALNKELCVFFGDNLYLDYENPVPEDTTMGINNTVNVWKSGLVTRNEARSELDYEPLNTPEGEEFFVQPAPQFGQGASGGGDSPIKPEDANPVAPAETGKSAHPKALFKDDAAKEEFWKSYVRRVEAYETPIVKSMTAIFEGQKQEALESMKRPAAPGVDLIDKQSFIKKYTEAVTPVLENLMKESVKNGMDLVGPRNPHKADIPPVVNARALDWLRQRVGWAAMEIGEETAKLLGQALTDGFAAGESMDDIAKRVMAVFEVSPARAMRIARTETIAASNQGALAGYGETGIVHKVEFYTAIDERVCEDCNNFHGDLFTLDDAVPMIPLHCNCRCCWLPVIE